MLSIKISLIFLVAVAGCDFSPSISTTASNQNSLSPRQAAADILSKDIVVFIGRGGCCYGHIISIDKKGGLTYSVGTYHRSSSTSDESSEYLPDTFDLNSIEVDKTYAQKFQEVPVGELEELERLAQKVERLNLPDSGIRVDDGYLYQIFANKKRIAFGYSSHSKSFPVELKALITFVNGQVELHKLPGMA